MHENECADEAHSYKSGFARRLLLRQKELRNGLLHLCIPHFFLQLNFKGVVTTINTQHQRVIFLSCNLVFNEEATVRGVQPETESETQAKGRNIGE